MADEMNVKEKEIGAHIIGFLAGPALVATMLCSPIINALSIAEGQIVLFFITACAFCVIFVAAVCFLAIGFFGWWAVLAYLLLCCVSYPLFLRFSFR